MKLIIIGAGPGGYETAVAAARKGLDVTLITAGPLGGTCLNEGCIPTKCLCHDAHLYRLMSEKLNPVAPDSDQSIPSSVPDDALAGMVARKDAVVEQLRSGVESLLRGVEIVRGIARIVNAHTVHVWPTETASDMNLSPEFDSCAEYTADRIIIATGSHPAWLNVPGAADTPGVLSSSDMLRLKELPKRLTVIGGGVIGLEFASVFASLGSKVTVIEYCKTILPHFDADLAKRLKQSLSKSGITILTGTEVTGISESEEASSECAFPWESGAGENPDGRDSAQSGKLIQIVTVRSGEKASAVVSDRVLMAVGRVPDTRVITGCKGIEADRRGIHVDENMQTTLPGVYAIGDVNGRMMLAHAATFQGRVALEHILGGMDGVGEKRSGDAEALLHGCRSSIRLDIMPAAVFTVPEVAAVGLTEEDCKEKGIAFKALKSFYRANGKALASDASEGYCKLIVAQPGQPNLRDGQILGCHILGSGASDLIGEVTALMNFNATVSELRNIIHPHPTLSEIIQACAAM